MNYLTLQQAESIVDNTLAEARLRELSPLCVAVLDAGGHLTVLKREDGASNLRPQIAYGKAAGALGMGFNSRELARRAEQAPSFFNALIGLSNGNLVPAPGGVLIRDTRGELIGAVGVSGDTSDNDEMCAVAAVVAAGLVTGTDEIG